jgi:hypothetical protein
VANLEETLIEPAQMRRSARPAKDNVGRADSLCAEQD